MPLSHNRKPTELFIPEKMRVMVTHKARNRMKTTIQSGMIPINFPDGLTGALTVTKVVKDRWKPSNDIDRIVIYWK